MLISPKPNEAGTGGAGASNGPTQSKVVADVLDPKHTAQLRNLMVGGKATLFHELCAILRSEAPPRLELLRKAVAQRNGPEASRLSHAFIGSASSIGARQLQSCMRSMEQASANLNWTEAEICMTAIDEAWVRLMAAIDAQEKKEDS